MSKELISLDQVSISSPCAMDWEAMEGDEQVRFCLKCQKNVYNLAGMDEPEAVALINASSESGICGRLAKRPDGTIVDGDCSAKGRTSLRRYQFSVASLLVLLTMAGSACASAPWIGKQIKPLVDRWFATSTPAQSAPQTKMMGKVDIPLMGVIDLGDPEDKSDF